MGDIVQADLVKETTATQGLGTYNLAGASAPFRDFASAIGDGKSCWYCVSNSNDFEIGLGTITAGAPDTLSRDKVIASSNGGAAVNWGAGNKDVRLVMPADLVGSLIQDARAITASAALTTKDNGVLLLANANGGAFSQNLPAIADVFKGYTIAIIKTDVSANAVTLDGSGAETINGAATLALPGQYNIVIIASDGAEWKVLALSGFLASAFNTNGKPINESLATVASHATAADIWGAGGNVINFTGAVTVTAFPNSPRAGTRRTLVCAAACGFTAGANMLIDGLASGETYIATAGDKVHVIAFTVSQFRLTIAKYNPSPVVAVAALDIDCSKGDYFTKTINGASTFTFSNAPSGKVYAFTLELEHTSGAITWPAAVKWNEDTAPSLTTGKTHLFIFVTDDGGTRWRGGALVNYTT